MKIRSLSRLLMVAALTGAATVHAAVRVVTERNDSADATAAFKFRNIPAPARQDAAATGTFTLVEGIIDPNGGGLAVLNDGRLPTTEDQPARNLFFNARTAGGRLHLDLGRLIEVRAVNSYSWHAGQRAPQVYKLFASDGLDPKFNPKPTAGIDPVSVGWRRIAEVDTRAADREPGGQHGVNIADPDGTLGRFQHLLFDCSRTTRDDPFDQTFYSEIDVIDASAAAVVETVADAAPEPVRHSFETKDGRYRFTLDTTIAPDLTAWATHHLVPVVQEWYPRIVALLPSEDFVAPERVLILFRDDMGGTPASAGGGRINCNLEWFRRNLRGEAVGSVVHEMVHVVQQYGRPLRGVPGRTRPPGWLVEGIPDYIRWFLYEPASRGAEITARNFERARFDGNYRISANFLNWVVEQHGPEIIVKLNAAAREGRYREELWVEFTGKTVQQLGDAWREANRIRLGLPPTPEPEKAVSP
jgi:hypothetical protein